MFVEPAYKVSREYEVFWHNLRCGKFQAGQYKRFGKGQREIWIEASYNPILDLNGEPYKVVKFATDITRQAQLLANLNRLIEQNFAEIDHALGQSNRQTTDASASASETSNNVQMMAAAAEELASSVAEISEAMAKSRAETDSAALRRKPPIRQQSVSPTRPHQWAVSLASFRTLPARSTCSRSMQPSRQRAPARPGVASPSSPRR